MDDTTAHQHTYQQDSRFGQIISRRRGDNPPVTQVLVLQRIDACTNEIPSSRGYYLAGTTLVSGCRSCRHHRIFKPHPAGYRSLNLLVLLVSRWHTTGFDIRKSTIPPRIVFRTSKKAILARCSLSGNNTTLLYQSC
jgi:hypothetical protein